MALFGRPIAAKDVRLPSSHCAADVDAGDQTGLCAAINSSLFHL